MNIIKTCLKNPHGQPVITLRLKQKPPKYQLTISFGIDALSKCALESDEMLSIIQHANLDKDLHLVVSLDWKDEYFHWERICWVFLEAIYLPSDACRKILISRQPSYVMDWLQCASRDNIIVRLMWDWYYGLKRNTWL